MHKKLERKIYINRHCTELLKPFIFHNLARRIIQHRVANETAVSDMDMSVDDMNIQIATETENTTAPTVNEDTDTQVCFINC